MGLIVRRVNISGAEGINFGNLRTGIFKLRKFPLCLLAPLLHSSNPLDLAARLPGRTTQFTRWEITVFARLAASLATAIQALRCPDRERSWVWPPELILQSEDAIGSFFIQGTAGACRSRHGHAKTWPSETGDELSVNHAAGRHEDNIVCSGAVGGDYVGADWPIRKADCEGGDRRDSF